jgi:hypothetical protein
MSEDMVHRALAAFNEGNAAGFAGLFTEDGVMMDYPDKVAGTGRAQIQAYLDPLFRAFPRARVALHARIDLGARQVTHERFDRGDGSPEYDAALVYTISHAGIVRMDFVRALAVEVAAD